MNHIMKLFAVLTTDSFPSVDSSTIIACFPPDDIEYDYEFDKGKGGQLYNTYPHVS